MSSDFICPKCVGQLVDGVCEDCGHNEQPEELSPRRKRTRRKVQPGDVSDVPLSEGSQRLL